MSQNPLLQEKLEKKLVEENLDKGTQILDYYKGITLFGLSGDSSDNQSLARGHFGGQSAGGIATLVFVQTQLNDLGSLKPELIPVMKKVKYYPGIIWVNNKMEAFELAKKHNLNIVQKGDWTKIKGEEKEVFTIIESEKNRYYYDYKGFVQRSSKISDLAYNIARASGSFQGETKQVMSQALSNIKPVPVFPTPQSFRPTPETYGDDEDAD